MARADTFTLLPLDRFARIVGINPLHFNQVEVAELSQADTCNMPILQHSWQQADRIGREEIAQAISMAEESITSLLGFYPSPKWISEEDLPIIQPANPELFATSLISGRGLFAPHRLDKGYFLYGGKETKTLIQNENIVYSDPNGDGYDDLATVTVPTVVTDPEEIAVYYPGTSGDDAWEIRPINVVLAGGNATITFRREQCVLPELMDNFNPRAVDGLNDSYFLADVDVYRHYNDPSVQVQFIWEYGVGYTQDYGCMVASNPRLSIVRMQPAFWDIVTQMFTPTCTCLWRPNRARVSYRAGWKYKGYTSKMDPIWERAISYLALSYLDRPLCGCSTLEAFLQYWRENLAERSATMSSSVFTIGKRVMDNPLGTTRAAQYVHNLIINHRVGAVQ